MAFGKPFDCLKEGVPHPWIKVISGLLLNVVYVSALSRFPTPIFKIITCTFQYFLLEDLKKGKEFVERRVASRLEQGTGRKDFVSPIFELVCRRKAPQKSPTQRHNFRASADKGMTIEEMESSLEILVIAGIRNDAMCGYLSIL